MLPAGFSTVNLFSGRKRVVDAIEAMTYMVFGFAPTLAALEIAWKMGKKIGKRGEVAPVAKAH